MQDFFKTLFCEFDATDTSKTKTRVRVAQLDALPFFDTRPTPLRKIGSNSTLKPIGDAKGELMSCLKVDSGHDIAGCLGQTKI